MMDDYGTVNMLAMQCKKCKKERTKNVVEGNSKLQEH